MGYPYLNPNPSPSPSPSSNHRDEAASAWGAGAVGMAWLIAIMNAVAVTVVEAVVGVDC
jgi:hypothetical protein